MNGWFEVLNFLDDFEKRLALGTATFIADPDNEFQSQTPLF